MPDAIDVLVPHHRRVRLVGVTVHRSLHVPDHHVRSFDGLRTTTVDRTLGDLGSSIRSSTVARAVEQAVIQRKTTIDRLYRFADEHGRRGRTGIGALRAALDDWALGERPPDSVLEVVFASLVRRFDLPPPAFQHVITDAGGFVARVDAAWPDGGSSSRSTGSTATARPLPCATTTSARTGSSGSAGRCSASTGSSSSATPRGSRPTFEGPWPPVLGTPDGAYDAI